LKEIIGLMTAGIIATRTKMSGGVQQKVQKIGNDLNSALKEEETLSNTTKSQLKELLTLWAEIDRHEDYIDRCLLEL
jgi:hypothetical protein